MGLVISRLKELRIGKGLTQAGLAKRLNTSRSAVAMWEVAKNEPTGDMLVSLAKVLDCTVGYLLGVEDNPNSENNSRPSNLHTLSSLHHQRVPLIGKVAAGQPIMAETDYETYVASPVDCDAALEVQGDSMVPTYMPGDIIYIKCRPDINNGQIAVVLIDDEVTLKHVYKRPGGLTLISDNPDYEPIMVDGEEHEYIAIYGIPVGYTRMHHQNVK